MKSFVAYPSGFEKMLFPHAVNGAGPAKVIAHYELFKKVRNLDGSIIKCGISAEEGFTRFAMFKSLMKTRTTQKMIAFQKNLPERYSRGGTENTNPVNFQINSSSTLNEAEHVLVQKGLSENVEFVAGDVHDSIPYYLIENPELKIAFLDIDFDNYESTLTALEYLFPRLVEGGILVIDNYFKTQEEYQACKTYFSHSDVFIHSFPGNNGPHFLVR